MRKIRLKSEEELRKEHGTGWGTHQYDVFDVKSYGGYEQTYFPHALMGKEIEIDETVYSYYDDTGVIRYSDNESTMISYITKDMISNKSISVFAGNKSTSNFLKEKLFNFMNRPTEHLKTAPVITIRESVIQDRIQKVWLRY